MKQPYQPDFPDATRRAMDRWPDVPAVHGWLRLDRRGRWFVREGEVTHAGALAFLNANYGADAQGRWFVQNGPQRAFVTLDLAPWILRLGADGALHTHTGVAVEGLQALVPTTDGDLCLAFALGLGSLLDRDLPAFVEQLSPAESGGDVARHLLGETPGQLVFRSQPLEVRPLAAACLPGRFGFVRDPVAP